LALENEAAGNYKFNKYDHRKATIDAAVEERRLQDAEDQLLDEYDEELDVELENRDYHVNFKRATMARELKQYDNRKFTAAYGQNLDMRKHINKRNKR